MNFVSFIILLGISVVISVVLHYLLKFYVRPGLVSFFSKVIFGWIGAWLGTPVFGRWFEGVNYENVFIFPAILGCLALLVILTDVVKSLKAAS
ncbi:MAG: hypothetical protein WC865_14670 [Bacteroidales bacterium]